MVQGPMTVRQLVLWWNSSGRGMIFHESSWAPTIVPSAILLELEDSLRRSGSRTWTSLGAFTTTEMAHLNDYNGKITNITYLKWLQIKVKLLRTL